MNSLKNASLIRAAVLFLVFNACTLFADTNIQSTNLQTSLTNLLTPEIIVTANRYSIPVSEVGESVSVINEEKIQDSGKAFVKDLINTTPGVTLSQYGGLGGQSVISIRGGETGGTLVLLDGIPLNNPIISQEGDQYFDFANLSPDNIERIEIIRGPFSALYGSESMGGVINIITKEGSGDPKGTIDLSAGSYGTFKYGGGLSGGIDNFSYSFHLSRIQSDGFSQAVVTDETVTPPQNSYDNTTLSGKLVYRPFDGGRLDFVIHYNYANYFISDGPFEPDNNNNYISSDAAFKIGFDHIVSPWWDYDVSLCYLNSYIENNGTPDEYWSSYLFNSYFKSENLRFSVVDNFHVMKIDTMTAGLDLNTANGSDHYYSSNALYGPYTNDLSLVSRTNAGMFIQNQLGIFDSLYNTSGIRLDTSPYSGNVINYRTSLLYRINEIGLSLKGNIGTGYKDPSLYQLYSSYGNPGLKPERSFGFDSGINESLFGGALELDAVYFQNMYSNMIIFDISQYVYSNEASVTSKGVEISLKIRPLESIEILLFYTYTYAINPATGEQELYIPMNKLTGELYFYPANGMSINIEYIYTGVRNDLDGNGNLVAMEDYSVFNFCLRIDFGNFDIYARIDNIFNNNYQDIYGYNTGGLMFSTGLTIKL